MSRTRRVVPMLRALALILATVLATAVWAPAASAQDVDQIVDDLEDQGWHIESGGEGSPAGFDDLVAEAADADDPWYFVSLSGPVGDDFADDLRDIVRPTGNVLVYFLDGEFINVQLASAESDAIEDRALRPFDDPDWVDPEDFMDNVVVEFDALTDAGSSSTSTAPPATDVGAGTTASADDSSGGGGFWWWLLGALGLGGVAMWWSNRRRKKKALSEHAETADKIRAEIRKELDELANDVLVLNGPVDLSENAEAISHYREAAQTYTAISDEFDDLSELDNADLGELSELGARVAHARWQMDAAEAIIEGEPIPEKPEVEPPPPPPAPAQPAPQEPIRIPQRQPRPRVPYRRRRSGGGLLDILIAGAGMAGRGGFGAPRGGGGMFGQSRGRSGGGFGGSNRGRNSGGMFDTGSSRTRDNRRSGGQRPGGGGLFGGGNRSGSSRGRSSGSSSSRSRRSTSRSRRRSRSSSSSRSRSGFSGSRRSSSSSRRSSSRSRRRR